MKSLAKKYWLYILVFHLLAISLLTGACGSGSNLASEAAKPPATATLSASTAGTAAANKEGNVSNPRIIRVYASLPLNGAYKNQGEALLNAMQLALSDATNGTGLAAGYKLELLPLDSTSPQTGLPGPDIEASNAARVAADPAAMLYLGPLSTQLSQISIPVLNRAGLAMISPGATYPGLTKSIPGITKDQEPARYYPAGTRNFFRLLPTDELQGRAGASFINAKLQAEKVYLVDDGSDYGQGLIRSFKSAADDFALAITGSDSLPATVSVEEKVIQRIKDARPEVIYYAGNSRLAAKFVTSVRAAGIRASILSGNAIQDEIFLEEAGEAGNGVYSSIGGTDSSGLPAKGSAFLTAYRSRFGDTLQATTIYGYDAMSAAIAAIKQAGQPDRAAVLKAVSTLKDFDGATGKWSFNRDGDINLTIFSFYVVKNQKWTFDSVADTNTSGQQTSNPIPSGTITATVGVVPGAPTPLASPTVDTRLVSPASTSAASAIITPPGSAGRRVDAVTQLPPAFKLYRFADLPVAVYLPPPENGPVESPQVLLALHGMFYNGGGFGANLLEFASKNRLVLVAPTFNYNVNFQNPEIIVNENLLLASKLNQIVSQLAVETKITFKDKLLLFGFSRGAQLAHHYAMFYPEQTLAVSVHSAGAYTLPLTEVNNRPIMFPFGLANMTSYTRRDFDREAFARIPFNVQVGAQDNDPKQVSRAWDRYIGNNRVARAEAFYRGLQQAGVKASFAVVPATGHEINPRQVEYCEKFLEHFVRGQV